jgi:hypothetical protein
MITLSGDTGISNISNAVSTGNSDLSKLNAVNALPGSVIQVVQTIMSNTFSVSPAAGTFSEVTPLTTIITPQFATSKILVLSDIKIGTSTYMLKGKLLRNGAPLALGDAAGTRARASFFYNTYSIGSEVYNVGSGVTQYLDSPNSTGPCVYSIQLAAYSTYVAYVNRASTWQDGGSGAGYDGTSTSSITLMEIRQ